MNRKQQVIKGGLLEIILFLSYPQLKTSIIDIDKSKNSKEKVQQLEMDSKNILKEIQREEIDELINNLSNRELNGFEWIYLHNTLENLLDKEYIILNQGEKYNFTHTNTKLLKNFLNKIRNEQMSEFEYSIPIDKNIINGYDGDAEINDFEIYFNDDYDISFDYYKHCNLKRIFNVLSEDIDLYRTDIYELSFTFSRSIMSRLVEECRMAHVLDWELYGKLSDLSKIKLILPECERIFKKVQLVVDDNKMPVLTQLYNLIMKANREDLSYNTLSLRNKYLHGDYDGTNVNGFLIDRCMIEFLFTCLCFISFKNNVDII